MLEWIFFDIGNVILNDDPAMAFFYHEIYQAIQQNGRRVSLDEVLRARERSILVERNGKHYEAVGQQFLDRRTWHKIDQKIRRTLAEHWQEFSPLIPGIVPVIQFLASRFKLGLIANQPREVIDVLEHHDLLKYFGIHGISQIVGFSKPHPAIFQWALAQAGCQPDRALMIGDRIDNDIVPARALHFKTLWLSLPLQLKGYQPQNEFERRYFQSLEKASASKMPPRDASEMPDASAEDFETILTAVAKLEAEAAG